MASKHSSEIKKNRTSFTLHYKRDIIKFKKENTLTTKIEQKLCFWTQNFPQFSV